MRHLTFIVVSCTLAAHAASVPTFAQQPEASPFAQQQPGGGGSGGGGLQLKPHPLIAHLPDAQNCPAPDWIVPGMRLTYFSSVSQTPSNAGTTGWVVDPNGMITLDNGQSVSPDRQGYGIAGSGWDFTDIVAVEPGVIVLEMRSYHNTNGLQGPAMASGVQTFFVHPSGCDNFIHPRLLSQLQQTSGNGVTLVKGQTQHRGANYTIVLSATQTNASKEVSVFDLSSGVQLQHNSKFVSQGDMRFQPNNDGTTFTPEASSTVSLANNQFHGARKTAPPWPTMKIPQWAKTMKSARFQGQRIDSGTPEMGLGRLVTNITFDVQTAYVGQTFIAYTTQVINQMEGLPAMEPIKGMMASGTACFPSMWMDPDCMKGLKPGQVLDTEPNTGVTAMIEHIGPDRNSGKQVLVISSGNQIFKSTSTFDMSSGACIALGRTEKSGSTGGTITTQLQLVSMQ